MLHLNVSKEDSKLSDSLNIDANSNPSNSSKQRGEFSGTLRADSTILLGTATIPVCDRNENFQSARVLLNSGSQISDIKVNCTARLRLNRRKHFTQILRLTQSLVNQIKGVTTCSFTSYHASDLVDVCNDLIVLPL